MGNGNLTSPGCCGRRKFSNVTLKHSILILFFTLFFHTIIHIPYHSSSLRSLPCTFTLLATHPYLTCAFHTPLPHLRLSHTRHHSLLGPRYPCLTLCNVVVGILVDHPLKHLGSLAQPRETDCSIPMSSPSAAGYLEGVQSPRRWRLFESQN